MIKERIVNSIIFSNQNALISGRAGTGKSRLIKMIEEGVKGPKVIRKVAYTGIAASNIRGNTIHSFFKIQDELLMNIGKKEVCCSKESKLYQILFEMQLLIIDEFSMVPA
jgi:ATP-dependent DNA helicase PIF1